MVDQAQISTLASASCVVRDGFRQLLAYVYYFEDEPQRRVTMRRVTKDDAWLGSLRAD
jgi:hypothetical protein